MKPADEKTHTPGPWTYHIGLSAGIITGADDKSVIDGGGVTEDRPEWEANARLIAAAPDLLEAAKKAERLLSVALRFPLDTNENQADLIALRSIIAKAEAR